MLSTAHAAATAATVPALAHVNGTAAPSGNVSAAAPSALARYAAVSDAVRHGKIAEKWRMPTLATSIANTAAVSGEPNSAENTLLMPHMTIRCVSFSSSRSALPS